MQRVDRELSLELTESPINPAFIHISPWDLLYASNRLIDSSWNLPRDSCILKALPADQSPPTSSRLNGHCKYMSRKTIAFWAMLKHFSNTVDQNIGNRGIYNLSFYCILKLSNQLKNIAVSSTASAFYNCETSTNPNWLLCYHDDKLEGSPWQARSSKQTDKACVKDAASHSFVRKCEKLRVWISHLVIYMKMPFHRCDQRLRLMTSSKSLMRIRNGFNLNWLGNQ